MYKCRCTFVLQDGDAKNLAGLNGIFQASGMGRRMQDRLLAVNLVLLPEPGVRQWCLDCNRQLTGGLLLGERDRIPHISLRMAVVAETVLAGLAPAVAVLSRRAAGLMLPVGGMALIRRTGRPSLVLLRLERTPLLMGLFAAAAALLGPHARTVFPDGAFLLDPGEVLSPSTRTWAAAFPGREEYEPHITLGCGDAVPELLFPRQIGIAAAALCRLGTHGSCRKPLF